ncbi:MAG: ComEC/Rec2 family competence protein [candidate division WOR-3 bacterium]|nr:MAG: ComEC/Rec2 family competence protein [candidate division WOR-3 bacterium]
MIIAGSAALLISLWKRQFLYLFIIVLSTINTSLHKPIDQVYHGRKALFSGTVIAETQYTKYKKLFIDLHDAQIDGKDYACQMPVEFYTHTGDVFSGKKIVVQGRLIGSEHAHRPMLLSGTLVGVEAPSSWYGNIIFSMRNYIEQTLAALFSPEHRTLSNGLVLGGSGRLYPEIREVFVRTGVLHVFAVSGLHVGFVCAFAGVLLLWIPISRKWKFVIIMLILCLYAAITGFRPSVCRAVLMAFLFGLSLLLQRNVDPAHITTMSAIVFLIINPFVLFDLSAQLSFAAVYGIVLVYPFIRDKVIVHVKSRIAKYLLVPLGISFSAQVCVWPLLIYYFHRLPTLAVIANLFIVPIASVTIFLLFSVLIMNTFFTLGAQVLAFFVSRLLHVLVFVSTIFARIPFANVAMFVSPVFLVLAYGLYARRTRPYAAAILSLTLVVWSISFLWNGVEIKAAPDAVLVTLPHSEQIFIVPERNISIQHAVLHDHSNGEPEYMIARDRTFTPAERLYEYPDELTTLRVLAGDVIITCDREISVNYHDTVVFSDHDWHTDQTDVLYILSDSKRTVRFTVPLYSTILDHIIRDLRVTFIKLQLLFS